MLLSNSCPSGFLYHLRSHKTGDQEECWQLHLLAQWCFLQMPFHIWMGRWTMEAASPMHSPPRLNALISSHAKSTEWPLDAYNYSLEAGYLPKYIFTCLHWNFVPCPLYPKTVNLDGERKDDKYKGKFSTNEFWAAKDGTDVARVSATQRPHAILCIDSDVETVSSLLDAATHHMQDMRIHIWGIRLTLCT